MPIVPDRYRGKKEYLIAISELINAARYGGTTTYQEIALIAGLPLRGSHMGREVGHLLGEIAEDEVNKGRPMLSAVVVGMNGKPGEGLFSLAKEFGRLTDDTEEGKQKFMSKSRRLATTLGAEHTKSDAKTSRRTRRCIRPPTASLLRSFLTSSLRFRRRVSLSFCRLRAALMEAILFEHEEREETTRAKFI